MVGIAWGSDGASRQTEGFDGHLGNWPHVDAAVALTHATTAVLLPAPRPRLTPHGHRYTSRRLHMA